VELACVKELSRVATGVQLNWCAALWVCIWTGVQLNGYTSFMGVQPWLERIPRFLSDGKWSYLCWTWQVLRTDTCSSVVAVFRQSYYLVSSSSNRHITTHPSLSFFSPILCNTILMNVREIGDCYRDFPWLPACCRNPLFSRSRQGKGYRQKDTSSPTRRIVDNSKIIKSNFLFLFLRRGGKM
jgi:hypothetical protein